MWPSLSVLVLVLNVPVKALYCFEGTNCELSACGECEGIACVRVLQSPVRESYNTFFGSMKNFMGGEGNDYFSSQNVAFTCLPVGTRMYDLEPEGCRVDVLNQRKACICYNNDYCNSSFRPLTVIWLTTFLVLYYTLAL
ncbi:unnamed protein product [Bursaphelenchus okinawaensis]|uniref:Protein sleepless n=1 Tax=Bursaphelenchus okinawaensis TaxID=465554 RepID=A0A811L9D0_9BILA|nr:unnamed protein product [Bursaphelenchus okinawaensis]CAG9119695.1 unnamed protein product [Bursaphelenchus okinawaensis]